MGLEEMLRCGVSSQLVEPDGAINFASFTREVNRDSPEVKRDLLGAEDSA